MRYTFNYQGKQYEAWGSFGDGGHMLVNEKDPAVQPGVASASIQALLRDVVDEADLARQLERSYGSFTDLRKV